MASRSARRLRQIERRGQCWPTSHSERLPHAGAEMTRTAGHRDLLGNDDHPAEPAQLRSSGRSRVPRVGSRRDERWPRSGGACYWRVARDRRRDCACVRVGWRSCCRPLRSKRSGGRTGRHQREHRLSRAVCTHEQERRVALASSSMEQARSVSSATFKGRPEAGLPVDQGRDVLAGRTQAALLCDLAQRHPRT